MTDKLKIWDTFANIDPKFTKEITGKPYKGTSPNPQYVIKCLTELFGPIGQGFGWDVVAEGFLPIGDEVLHWCRIRFWHTDRAHYFESYGQTKALMKTRNGLMLDEDAPKKSLTDAITKAASSLGIAANIFLGRWDDSKYVEQVRKDYEAKDKDSDQPGKGTPERDPKAIAVSLCGVLHKAEDRKDLIARASSPKFDDPYQWLRANAPTQAAEVDGVYQSLLKQYEAAA